MTRPPARPAVFPKPRQAPAAAPRSTPAATADAAPARAQGVALWQQLQHVALLVQAVQGGSSTGTLLAQVPPNLRPGVQALGFEVLRALGVARWLRSKLVPRTPPPLTDALLCTALALAWRQRPAPDAPLPSAPTGAKGQPSAAGADTAAPAALQRPPRTGYSDFTLVNQAVEAAKRHPALRHQAGLVNGVLRRYLREHAALAQACAASAPAHDADLLNLPRWWLERLQRDHGAAAAQRVAHANLQAAPMTLRVNAQYGSAQDYLAQQLRPAGLDGALNGPYGITLQQAVPVQQLPGFAQGLVSVQDAAAQLAAPLLLSALPTGTTPLRLLDACAAPGGKTAHLLELAPQHQVTALDVDAERSARIHDTLQRLGLQARVLTADAGVPASWWDGVPFDGILLDAPCTASGIARRHPDVLWLRRAEDVAHLAAQQQRLLEALWPLLKPGGVLLYCTCSVFRAEGQAQVDAFLLRHTEARQHMAPGHLLPLHLPQPTHVAENGSISLPPASSPLTDHDGFFYALLAKHG